MTRTRLFVKKTTWFPKKFR